MDRQGVRKDFAGDEGPFSGTGEPYTVFQDLGTGRYGAVVGGKLIHLGPDLLPFLQTWLDQGNTLDVPVSRATSPVKTRLSPLAPHLQDESGLFGFLPAETKRLIQTQSKYAANVTTGLLTDEEYKFLSSVRRSLGIMIPLVRVMGVPDQFISFFQVYNLSGSEIPYQGGSMEVTMRDPPAEISLREVPTLVSEDAVKSVVLDVSKLLDERHYLDVKSFFMVMKRRFMTAGFTDPVERAKAHLRDFLRKLMDGSNGLLRFRIWLYLWTSARSMELEVPMLTTDRKKVPDQLLEYAAAVQTGLDHLY